MDQQNCDVIAKCRGLGRYIMKIIKEKDAKHEVFKSYNELENVLELYRFEEPSGFMVIRRTGDCFKIKISAQNEITELDEIKQVLKPYINGKVYMILDINQDLLCDYIKSKGIKLWFGYYEMSIESYDREMTYGELKGYEGKDECYGHILGKAFEPMRTLHGFEPFDWYAANPEEGMKEFLEAHDKNNFYSYYVDDKLVGVGIVIDNMIDVIGIEPTLQKKGYGKQLLRGVVNDMLKKDIKKIEIGVVESNQHVYKLYSDEGFKTDCHSRMYKNY